MRTFGQWLGYLMPFLLLCGPILAVLQHFLIGAVCVGLGLFALSIKVDVLLSRLPATPNQN
jgi:hypothetical protein